MLPKIFNTGLNSDVWGDGAWTFLHSITLTYSDTPTETDKIIYKRFFEDLGYLLPCNKCSNHYNEYLQSNPLDSNILKDKLSLTTWLYNLHNNTNDILNKNNITFDKFIDSYINIYTADSPIDNNNKINVIIIILLIILIIVSIYKFSCKNQ